ncbi:uncharacterized protein LOC135197791 [Macrobrachium nipponense]|uniref:uncharacterized protein LOC135197791 n=1 Tax=Macrobrachium nipponense TaxID=159736 RepID=UPI0030C83B60
MSIFIYFILFYLFIFYRVMNSESKFWLDGILVLGQDQDSVGGNFPIGQMFRGRISQVSLWSRPLAREELLEWTKCGSTVPPGNILSWSSSPWVIYGDVREVAEIYCDDPDSPVFLFQSPMVFEDVLKQLEVYGMSLAAPQTPQSLSDLAAVLAKAGSQCAKAIVSFRFAWIADSLNSTNITRRDYPSNGFASSMCANQSFGIYPEMPVLLTTLGGVFKPLACDSSCFFGEYPDLRSTFYLRGLCKNGMSPKHRLAPEFVFSGNPDGDSFLVGLTGMSIQMVEESKWILFDSDENSTIASTYSTLAPVGRMEWETKKDNIFLCDDSGMLVLSKCAKEDDFTCDNGSCISIASRCNMIPECSDWSDEKNCTRIQLPPAYMSEIPPKLPMTFRVVVDIDHVEVNLLKMTISLEMSIEFIWYEERIAFKNLQADPAANQILRHPGKEWPIWVPEISLSPVTSYGNIDHQPSLVIRKTNKGKRNGDDIIHKGSESPIIYKITQHPTIRCPFCLKRYPHDEQFCRFKIMIVNVPMSSLDVSNVRMNFFGNSQLQEYLVKNWSIGSSDHTVEISFHLHRRIDHELLATYFPTNLLILIAYGTLFIGSDNFSDRGAMSLTTMLVLISLYTESLSSLPTTSYNKEIDKWYLFAINYVSLIIAVHLVTSKVAVEPKTITVKPLPNSSWSTYKEKTSGMAKYLRPEKILKGARILFGLAIPTFLTYYYFKQVSEHHDPCSSD